MGARLLIPTLAAALLGASAPQAPKAPAPTLAPTQAQTAPELGAWLTYWALDPGLRSARAAKGGLSDAFLFALQLDSEGLPALARPEKEKDYLRALAELRRLKARVWLTVVNDHPDAAGKNVLKDTGLVHAVVTEPARRKLHIAGLVQLCLKYKVDGLDVDYENLDPADRAPFAQFIAELGEALHAKKLALSVTVQPKQRESRSVGPGGADWAALGKSVDRFQIMLYNQHNARTVPGPVAAPAWIEGVLAYAAAQVDRAKIVPVLKVSGFEWGPKPREIGWSDVALRLRRLRADKAEPEREAEGRTPHLSYDVDGKSHVAYIDDAESLRTKLDFLRAKGYPRVVLWSLGAEDPALWEQETDKPAIQHPTP